MDNRKYVILCFHGSSYVIFLNHTCGISLHVKHFLHNIFCRFERKVIFFWRFRVSLGQLRASFITPSYRMSFMTFDIYLSVFRFLFCFLFVLNFLLFLSCCFCACWALVGSFILSFVIFYWSPFFVCSFFPASLVC